MSSADTQNSAELKSLQIKPFDPLMDRTAFSCIEEDLNKFFQIHCEKYHAAYKVRCRVATIDDRIVGYYWLCTDGVPFDQLLDVDADEFPEDKYFSIPCVYVGMLAVDKSQKGKEIGKVLMLQAMRDTLAIAEFAGVFALTLEAIKQRVADHYQTYGFQYSKPGPNGEIFMHIKLATIRQLLKPSGDN